MVLNHGYRFNCIWCNYNRFTFIPRNERNRCTMSWEVAFYNFAVCLIVFIFLTLVGAV
jgi:hypothetical protein